MRRESWVVSVVGATGLVGSEITRTLISRSFPFEKLLLFSSGRTCGYIGDPKLGCDVRAFRIEEATDADICFLAAGREFSLKFAEKIASARTVVIDNSSAFRMRPDVPLVVPEVNAEDVFKHRGIIANPNCSTIQMVVALAPLHRLWRIRKIVVSTYQSVSGAGSEAVARLAQQSSAILAGEELESRYWTYPLGFNLIPQIGEIDSDGWSYEERKMIDETRKILGDQSIEIVATAVRVPVFRCHAEALYVEFESPVEIDKARDALRDARGVELIEDRSTPSHPMPIMCEGKDATFVGRLRRHPEHDNGLCMWVVSDNLRKGAALNAVQIGELLLRG